MLLKLDNPKILDDIVRVISELVTEVKIKINKQGLSIIAIDPANVALVSFNLPASSFSQLEVEEEIIGINLDSLKSVLRRSSSSSALVLQTEEGILRVEIQEETKRTFKLALINIEQEEKEMPNLEFSCNVELGTGDFAEAIEDCSIVADSCSFIVERNKFIMESKGINSAKSEFSEGKAKIENKAEKIKSKYSLEYLEKFIKAGKIADKIKINFADDYPLRLDFISPGFELSFVLAPRVESED